MTEDKGRMSEAEERIYDCIIIGAGPGGLQAAIYLGRYNRDVLLIDRGGGRTWHARRIENFLTQRAISGREMIELGMEQARSFNVKTEKGLVTTVIKNEYFEVYTPEKRYLSKFVIVSSGAYDNLESIRFLNGRPGRLVGEEKLEAIELQDGQRIPCDVIMSNFGYRLNDQFLFGLKLRKDPEDFKYVTNRVFESSLDGLYIVGPLTANDQAVIAAGEGAIAAVDLKRRLLER
jgi:thioredoxin reductase